MSDMRPLDDRSDEEIEKMRAAALRRLLLARLASLAEDVCDCLLKPMGDDLVRADAHEKTCPCSRVLASSVQSGTQKSFVASSPVGASALRRVPDLDRGVCMNVCEILGGRTYGWDCLPSRFRLRRDVRCRWGRVGIEFGEWIPTTQPGLLVGFLLDPKKHCVQMCDQEIGIDLLLTIDIGNTGKRLPSSVLRGRAEALKLAESSLAVRADRECRNHRQILTVQEPLSNVVGTWVGDADQIQTIYRRICTWCRILFDDGTLEAALDTLWPL